MTTSEFQLQLDNANTLEQLRALRSATGASKFISLIKGKVAIIAIKEGYTLLRVKMDNLRKLTCNTDTNAHSEMDIPGKNRTFSQFAGKKVTYYINHKTTDKIQEVDIFIK